MTEEKKESKETGKLKKKGKRGREKREDDSSWKKQRRVTFAAASCSCKGIIS